MNDFAMSQNIPLSKCIDHFTKASPDSPLGSTLSTLGSRDYRVISSLKQKGTPAGLMSGEFNQRANKKK